MNLTEGALIISSIVLTLFALGFRDRKRPKIAAGLTVVAAMIFALGVYRSVNS